MEDPKIWDDPKRAQELGKEKKALEDIVLVLEAVDNGVNDGRELFAMGKDDNDDDTLLAVEADNAELETKLAALEFRRMFNNPSDPMPCFLEIQAGAGGTEAQDWASMLLRMFQRFATRKGFEFTILDFQAGEEAGIKSMSALVTGPYAYGTFKSERGVHRLVRISPFDANKRRHTSFTALDVTAEIDDSIEINILDSDLRVDVYRSSGAGGQHVNVTDSAVRITHIPTGIVVQCQSERSQITNRAKCLKMLASRLYDFEMDQKKKEMERFYQPKGAIAWGSQIRSYVFQPYQMVKDHRTDFETSNVEGVMDGDLDGFVESWLKSQKASGEST